MTLTGPIRSGFAPVNSTSLYYELAGSGHPLVLLHGGLLDSRMWDDQFFVFARHYCVVRYDLRGAGKSAQADAPYTDHHDLAALLTFLGLKRTYLLGLSGGGAVAIDFTLQYPDQVDALIVAASGVSGYQWSEELQAHGARFTQLLTAGDILAAVEYRLRLFVDGLERTPEPVPPAVRDRVHTMLYDALTRPRGPGRSQALAPAALNRLAELEVPALILSGEHDVPDIHTIAEHLAADISGSQRIVIPRTAHMINMEQPCRFNQLVLSFLQGLGTYDQ